MNKKPLYICGVLVLIAISFYAGGKFLNNNQSSQTQNFQRMQGGNMSGRNGGMRNFGGQIFGEILSIDNQSLTIKTQTGSRIAFLSASTTASKLVDVKIDEIKVGEQISVLGKANSDGSLTADRLEIRK